MIPSILLRLHDGTVVIAGEHLTAEKAEARFGKLYRRLFERTGKIRWVSHGWIRYEKVGLKRSKEECDGCKPSEFMWFLHERRKPRGEQVREATIL